MADSDTPVLDLITQINADAIEASSLDVSQQMLVRVAALVAIDAPPASYLMNLGAAGETGMTPEELQGILCAIAPIVGTTRIVSAAGKLVRALGLAVGLAEFEEDG
jgi:alkylhydroperoxidase/carboxymuconolactone decarboxylase family protein YurZ